MDRQCPGLPLRFLSIQPEDLPACTDVYVATFNSPPWNETWTAATAASRLGAILGTPGFIGLKAVSEAGIIGFAMGYAETFDKGTDFYLKEMCVLPGSQRQGVGTDLLKKLTESLTSDGIRKIYLLTARDSAAATFYAKNGFYTSDRMVMMGRWLKPRE